MTVNRTKTNYITGLELDKDWMNDSLLLPRSLTRGDLKIGKTTYAWMYYSSADTKFTNTSLGGNFTINNPPQFTTFADPPSGMLETHSSKMALNEGMGGGMGQYYSEAIDDNAHRVVLRFGVPEYKGLFTFFSGFYNYRAATLANQGRTGFNVFYFVGKVVGMIIALPVTIAMMLNQAARFFFNRPSTRYYWLKPTMPLYWNRVNLISNQLAATLGIVPTGDVIDEEGGKPLIDEGMMPENGITEGDKYTSFSYDEVRDIMPGLFNKNGGIDIYRVSQKANRMQIRGKEELEAAGKTASSPKEFTDAVARHVQNFRVLESKTSRDTMPLNEYLTLYHKSILGAETIEVNGEQQDVTRKDAIGDRINSIAENAKSSGGGRFGADGAEVPLSESIGSGPTGQEAIDAGREYSNQDSLILSVLEPDGEDGLKRIDGGGSDAASGILDYAVDGFLRGAEFVSFKVDPNQTESESWSNSVGEAEITSTINGISNTVRAAKFGFSDFKSGFSAIDAPLQAITDTIGGLMDGFQLSGLAALAGTGLVDIPKRYQDSSVSLTSSSYTMELRCAYGDPLSIYMHLYLPLITLMAGALPISHGNQSYGAPMLCQLFDRGRNNIKLGMIDSLSVTRGTGDVGWNPDGLPLGLDVTFSVVDMSNIMHMPIDTGLSGIIPWNGLFGDDNAYSDYMATLGNLDINDQINPSRQLAIRWATKKINTEQYFNKARIGNAIASGNISRFLNNTFATPPAITTM